ncbi:hypothetical protein WMY93_013236 [Mugilogobius chulae]|uniref:ATM interactor n=1 Tax=Mugilogobius chulae TaxID=88201 RepID=A0AAW0NYW7_9GOBI
MREDTPNTPALNMHLVKSHRVKEGIVNPTVRKDMKGSQKLYCCPIDGCPRGPGRPFSQFSLVKQHFMKMHAEKKHKCFKCNNGYSTEWDLKRHIEDCGKTYQCTCGCPYASRAALLSHVYRTGHEIPTEHRIPPVKKRKMEKEQNVCEKLKDNNPDQSIPTVGEPTESSCCHVTSHSSGVITSFKTRQTQTCTVTAQLENRSQNPEDTCSDLFNDNCLSVSTQTTALDLEPINPSGSSIYGDIKSASSMCFAVQTEDLNTCNMADNQTQTMSLLNDLENILSDGMSSHQVLTETSAAGLSSVQEPHNTLDFDFEDFLSAVHIQTQTEESEFGGLSNDTQLESLDIQTQTDFLLMDELDQNGGQIRSQAHDLELFDTQTQTDLNFLLNAGSMCHLVAYYGIQVSL